MSNNDDQLQQQYQEILNKYASSLAPVPPVPPAEPMPEPMPEPVSEIKPQPILETPVIETPVIEKPPILPPISSSPLYFAPEPVADKPSSFFKYLFYLSLIIFIGVVCAIVYNLFASQTSTTGTSTLTPVPSVTASKICEVGTKKYNPGESFLSTDNCNTCTCTIDSTIVCTQKACISPTMTPKTPTAKPTVKAMVGKTYKDIKYGYQFVCPTGAKYVVEATSVNGNKIPFKQESCTQDEAQTIISVYDNTLIHDFGKTPTLISPDKKYIVTFEGDILDIMSSFKFL